MSKNLVIVESPAKAKTISGFLGKDFVVKSSFGHVRDLSKKELGVDIENGFSPNYEISQDKKKIIQELKKDAKAAEMVWLASDEDREGEAIAWHLSEALGLKADNTKRIAFHEITKSAIQNAIDNPRDIDTNLVNAQQARRVLDRLVGFELSPLLWKKVKPSLSAGRVQSVAVRLIVEREEEIRKFKTESFFKVSALFTVPDKKTVIKAELNKRFENAEEAQAFLEKCKEADFTVSDIEKKPSKKSPAPPFTTSTLQQEASRKLGFSVSRTMLLAQQLYESGKITYMRTDSVNLSKLALAQSKDQIVNEWGKEYSKTRQFQTKSKGAQEAHEAIRPTDMTVSKLGGKSAEHRLYELIWKRTIASQMSESKIEKTNVTLDISNTSEKFIARGEVILFDGFLKVYMESTDDEQEENKEILPPLTAGQNLDIKQAEASQRFTQSPPRFTEASLVRKMEELGIGRPSTYAPTISTIQKRGYAVREDRDGQIREYKLISLKDGKISLTDKTEKAGFEKSKLFPTDIGSLVNQFLLEYFGNIMDYRFTATVEKEFDEIAQGLKEWNEMINEFYHPFHERIEKTLKESSKVSGQRLLGVEPESGKNVYVKIGRYGPMVQIGEASEEEKPKFASLLKGQSIDTLNLEEALKLFSLPRVAGAFEEEEMVIGIGRFGPYVRHKGSFYSIPKTMDPLAISSDDAVNIILEKRKKDLEKFIKEFAEEPDIKILKGRYGPYIKHGKKNHKIPKGTEPAELSLEEVMEIIRKDDSSKAKKSKKK